MIAICTFTNNSIMTECMCMVQCTNWCVHDQGTVKNVAQYL